MKRAALVWMLVALGALALAQSTSVVGPSGQQRGPGRGPSTSPMPPGTPKVVAPLPPYVPTILAFDVTDPTGAKPNLTVSLYEDPVAAAWATDYGSGVAITYWGSLATAYDDLTLASGVGSFVDIPAGDYWYVIWSYFGYGYHGGATTPVLVSVAAGVTTTVTVAQVDTKWTDAARSSYNPFCLAGLSIDLGAGGSATFLAGDALAVAPPADAVSKIRVGAGAWADSLALDCDDVGVLAPDVLTWSGNRIYGDYCNTDLTVTDNFAVCGG
jgi:hypothetical protein